MSPVAPRIPSIKLCSKLNFGDHPIRIATSNRAVTPVKGLPIATRNRLMVELKFFFIRTLGEDYYLLRRLSLAFPLGTTTH